MKVTISCCYDDLLKHYDILDHPHMHILLWVNEALINSDELYESLSRVKLAELSIGVDLTFKLPSKFLQWCVMNRIILYFPITKEYSDFFSSAQNIDRVAVVTEDFLDSFDDLIAKNISDNNIHVCLINQPGDYKKPSKFYNKLLENGFSNLFQIAIKTSENEYSQFISRETLASFYQAKNMKTRDAIDRVSQNSLRRYNKSLIGVSSKRTEIVFVNLNLLPDSGGRKNLGIEYLASVLNSSGYYVECIYSHQMVFLEEIENYIIEAPSLKVIGFSCMQDNMGTIQNAISYLKIKYPHLIYVVGGAQATALSENFLREASVDYVMVGESEKNIVPLINYIFHNEGDLEAINGLRYISSDGKYTETLQSDLIENLDSIPFPLYVYQKDNSLRHAGIITGRGCPFNCSFCFEGAKEKTVRYRSLANVFEEISLLILNKKNLKLIQFYDDTFTLNANRVLSFCEQFKPIYDKYKVEWACEIHCQTVHNRPDLIRAMVECGLKDAQIGLESGNNNILKKLNKQMTPEMIFATIEACKTAGLKRLEGNILLGGAGESEEHLEEQFELAERLLSTGRGMFELNIAFFWPFPNTPITNNPEHYGVKILPDQCNYTINSIKNFVTESRTISRQGFVEHYYKLNETIQSLYDSIVLQLTASEILQRWGKEIYSTNSRWAQAIRKKAYISRFLRAKFNNDVQLSPTAFPVRTFDLLSYENNCLCLREACTCFTEHESRLLELCNGRNNVLAIAEKLDESIDVVIRLLRELEEKMFVYCASI